MRVVALQAIANGRTVHFTLAVGSVLVRVASQAQRCAGRGDQLDAGHLAIDAHLVAGAAPHGHRGMHRLALGLRFMALNTSG